MITHHRCPSSTDLQTSAHAPPAGVRDSWAWLGCGLHVVYVPAGVLAHPEPCRSLGLWLVACWCSARFFPVPLLITYLDFFPLQPGRDKTSTHTLCAPCSPADCSPRPAAVREHPPRSPGHRGASAAGWRSAGGQAIRMARLQAGEKRGLVRLLPCRPTRTDGVGVREEIRLSLG